MRVEQYAPRWHGAVLALANEVLGEGYFVRPSEVAGAPGAALLLGQENETLVCFAHGSVLPENGLRDHLEGQLPELPDEIAAADRDGALGVIQAAAVSPAHRRKGFGSSIISVLHDRLVGLGADKLIVTFKRGQNVPHVDGMMGKLGFEPWQRLPSFWRKRCDAGEFKCADRMDGCACEALLYRKTVF